MNILYNGLSLGRSTICLLANADDIDILKNNMDTMKECCKNAIEDVDNVKK